MKQAVLIMVDTQRQDMLSCYDADAAPTPVLDALAREGMQFTNGYTCQPFWRLRRVASSLLSSRWNAGKAL